MSFILSAEEVFSDNDHPRRIARALHSAKDNRCSFEALEEQCFESGCVICTPTLYLMAQEVKEGWFIWYASGHNALKKFMQFMPKWLPWIGFSRVKNGKQLPVRWYLTEQWRKKIEGLKE